MLLHSANKEQKEPWYVMRLLKRRTTMTVSNQLYHPTAEVSKKANIGEDTRVWNNAQVREGAVIGARCNIGKNVYIDTDVRIGSGVKIQNNANIYHGVTIEDDVFVGSAVTFINDRFQRAFNKDQAATNTLVRKGASIGANSTVSCGITLGKYCMVGANSVVTKDVPPYALVVGNPAKQIGWVCRCGAKIEKDQICKICGNGAYSNDEL